jgi:hypothetical protein
MKKNAIIGRTPGSPKGGWDIGVQIQRQSNHDQFHRPVNFSPMLAAKSHAAKPAVLALRDSGQAEPSGGQAPPRTGRAQTGTGVVAALMGRDINRNDVVEKRSCGSSSCDAPVAAGVGDASSPDLAAQPNRAPVFSRDEGVAFTFCDEASQLPLAATASFQFKSVPQRQCSRKPIRFPPSIPMNMRFRLHGFG